MANFSGLTTQRQEILNKWYDSGLLDGLDTPNVTKKNIASLLEGQVSHLVNEGLYEVPNNGGFDTVVFPIVRRVYARLFQDTESHYVEFKKDGLTPYNYVKKHKL